MFSQFFHFNVYFLKMFLFLNIFGLIFPHKPVSYKTDTKIKIFSDIYKSVFRMCIRNLLQIRKINNFFL